MMIRALIIVFMLAIFGLLVYSIFSPLLREASPKVVRHDEKRVDQSVIQSKKVKVPKSRRPIQTMQKEIIVPHERMTEPAHTVLTQKQRILEESIAELGGQIGDPVFMRIFKKEAVLEMWMRHAGKYHLIQTYPICAYSGDLGPKLKEGDGQSPEGFYYVTKSRLNPNSRFHLSFNLGYPNKYDRTHGRTGSYLMVHGDCVSIGCYAMTDAKIEEIYELVEQALTQGQKYVRVHIFPFRMTEHMMQRYRENHWYVFWKNLKEGYDLFEKSKMPPNVKVRAKRYIFD